MTEARTKIKVSDAFDAAGDPEMPVIKLALNPIAVKAEFKRGLSRLAGEKGQVVVKSIRVRRHKPGRRCVIEYDVRVERPGPPRQKVILIGKVRARRSGNEGYRLLDALWKAGFKKRSQDGISVPEPIGVIPKFQMWLQRKVPGRPATALLAEPGGVALARRIAEAIHKLHRTTLRIDRRHTMADELRILHECVSLVGEMKPEWTNRLERILAACDRLGASVPAPTVCGIHRDFYPAQVIVNGPRLYLLDFDLYCLGDPALDIGNFLGHITEQSLRTLGNPRALADRENALEERFVELSGEHTRTGVQAYATLTLVRHIYLSTQFPERRQFTERLLELCEERLGLSSPPHSVRTR